MSRYKVIMPRTVRRMVSKKFTISPDKRKFLEDLWSIWGNTGPKTTTDNHKFLQGLIERDGDYLLGFYEPDKSLLSVVDSILAQEVLRGPFEPCEKCGTKTFNHVDVHGRWAAWCGCPN